MKSNTDLLKCLKGIGVLISSSKADIMHSLCIHLDECSNLEFPEIDGTAYILAFLLRVISEDSDTSVYIFVIGFCTVAA